MMQNSWNSSIAIKQLFSLLHYYTFCITEPEVLKG